MAPSLFRSIAMVGLVLAWTVFGCISIAFTITCTTVAACLGITGRRRMKNEHAAAVDNVDALTYAASPSPSGLTIMANNNHTAEELYDVPEPPTTRQPSAEHFRPMPRSRRSSNDHSEVYAEVNPPKVASSAKYLDDSSFYDKFPKQKQEEESSKQEVDSSACQEEFPKQEADSSECQLSANNEDPTHSECLEDVCDGVEELEWQELLADSVMAQVITVLQARVLMP